MSRTTLWQDLLHKCGFLWIKIMKLRPHSTSRYRSKTDWRRPGCLKTTS